MAEQCPLAGRSGYVGFSPRIGGDHTLWLPLLQELEKEFNLLALDLPGHGSSQGAGESAVANYVEWVKDALGAYEVTAPMLIGHSLGAAIVPYLCRPPTLTLTTGVVVVGGGARMPVNSMIFEAIKKDVAGVMAMTAKIAVAKKHRERVAPLMLARTPQAEVLYGDFLACDRLHLDDKLDTISVPTLIVCGEEDKMTPPALSQELAEKIHQAKQVLIPETGHMVMLEEPVLLAQVLRDFVQTIPRERG